MASSVPIASSASQDKSGEENSSKESALDSKGTGTLVVSHLQSESKTVQLILTGQPSAQSLGSTVGRAPVVIASVSPSDQAKKSSLVAKLTQSGGDHLTGGQVAKICAATPQMSNAVGAGSGKPKAFASMMGGGDSGAAAASPKKQSSAKKGAVMFESLDLFRSYRTIVTYMRLELAGLYLN